MVLRPKRTTLASRTKSTKRFIAPTKAALQANPSAAITGKRTFLSTKSDLQATPSFAKTGKRKYRNN
ncbi:hypothetical protein NDU88_009430 [Pleurodeles waltl]|uniref:Uncharacterized protein n=1 Tax=Pleurodeles waltl TaxID=8319 RepID=A0AAV7RYD3_PLEWA|nr:hypothetical protein NDU88_009430 [Pleurodeles waltl]